VKQASVVPRLPSRRLLLLAGSMAALAPPVLAEVLPPKVVIKDGWVLLETDG